MHASLEVTTGHGVNLEEDILHRPGEGNQSSFLKEGNPPLILEGLEDTESTK